MRESKLPYTNKCAEKNTDSDGTIRLTLPEQRPLSPLRTANLCDARSPPQSGRRTLLAIGTPTFARAHRPSRQARRAVRQLYQHICKRKLISGPERSCKSRSLWRGWGTELRRGTAPRAGRGVSARLRLAPHGLQARKGPRRNRGPRQRALSERVGYLALPWLATALILASMVAGSPM